MSVPKAVTLAAVVILGLSACAQAAPRARAGGAPAYRSYGVQSGYGSLLRPALTAAVVVTALIRRRASSKFSRTSTNRVGSGSRAVQ